MSRAPRPDVAIVGGGPVGLVTAILARRAGLEAVVLEKHRPPIDKACGEGLMPDGVRQLESLGWTPDPASSAPIAGIRYLDGTRVAEAGFRGGRGLGVRRTVLHRGLVALAEREGVELRFGIRVTALLERGVAMGRDRIDARWIVGADGLGSRVRRWAGLEGRESRNRRNRRVGLRRHFSLRPWTDNVEVYWADRCEAYVTPVSPDEVGVAMLWNGERDTGRSSFDELLDHVPLLRDRLAGAPVSTTHRGAGPLYRLARRAHRGRVALVGDAAGYLDAITGEGLSLGFHQARALVEAMVAERLDLYTREVRRLTAFPFLLMRALLFAERRSRLRRRLIETLHRDPELFSRLLAIHARQLPPTALGSVSAMRLLRGLLLP